jgi:hypothetical protein
MARKDEDGHDRGEQRLRPQAEYAAHLARGERPCRAARDYTQLGGGRRGGHRIASM